MNTSGEVADQIVRMSLNGLEVAAKISGSGAKQLAAMLYAILKDQKKTKGKMRLQNMLKNGKELKVFAVRKEDLKKFTTEAKHYGVLYCVLREKGNTDGLMDIMVRAEDASKINRIFERFKLSGVDKASVISDIENRRMARNIQKESSEKEPPEMVIPIKSKEDRLIDQLMFQPGKHTPTQSEQTQNVNPTTAQTTKSFQSEPSSNYKNKVAKGSFEPERKLNTETDRPSVRGELNKIKQERAGKEPVKKEEPKNQKTNRHKEPPKKKQKTKKQKEKG